MGGGVARITQALTAAVLLSAAAAQAQIPVSVDDVRVAEGSSGFWSISIAVRLSGPPPTSVTVDYTILPGSALSGTDYTAVPANGTLTFPALSSAPQFIPGVQINGDGVDEWSLTLQQDKAFFVQLSNPSSGIVIDKGRGTVTLIDDDHANPPGVQFLTAVSTGTGAIGQNKLQWRIPGAPSPVANVHIAWKQGAGCSFPLSETDITGGGLVNVGSAAAPGAVQTYVHGSRPIGTPHCYSVFTYNGAGFPCGPTEIAHVKATPIDTTGTIAWSYASGAASVVPPSVGTDAIYTTDNVGVVHAMNRVAPLGEWPSGWNPVAVGKPTQNRSAVVPMGSRSRLFLGTDGGGVHAIDGKTGTVVWSRSAVTALPNVGGVQAQPAGLFKAFGGNNDMLLVGTNAGASNTFFALDPGTGNNLGSLYSNPLMGNVTGMAVVDYASNRVFFLTTAASGTFFGLDLGPSGAPNLTLATTLPGGNPRTFTGTNGSAVLRNSHLVWGDNASTVFGLDLTTGTAYSVGTGDGAVKGFLWPDRRDDRLYFSTNGNVQCLRDAGTTFASCGGAWPVPVTSPSMVLQKPGTDYLYVGDGQGRLIQIKVSDQSSLPLMLESGVQIGAPSLDGANNILVVGSATGTIYGVRVPF